MRIEEIDKRLEEIRSAVNEEGADLDALEKETGELIEERKGETEKAGTRKKMLDEIANSKGGKIMDNPFKAEERKGDILDTEEYREAFYAHLMGRPMTAQMREMLDEAEKRSALTSGSSSAGAVIPTQTADMVVRKLTQIAPVIGDITLFNVPGNLTVAVENSDTTAGALHTEGASASESGDTLVSVNLTGYEAIKILSISAKLKFMGVNAFESWLVDNITDGIAYCIENWIFNGTGSSQPKGIEKTATWSTTNSVTAAATTGPTYAEITKLAGLLPGRYDAGAVFYMSKSTLWSDFIPMHDGNKFPLVQTDRNGNFAILGYPVHLSDKVTAHVAYLGNPKYYYGNFAEPVHVEMSEHSSFRSGLTDYRGTAIFDGAPTTSDCFVKLAPHA